MHACVTGRQKQNKFSFLQCSLSEQWHQRKHTSNLNSKDRKKYEERLITGDGTVLPDPYALVENWKDNVKLLLDIHELTFTIT